MLVRIAAAAALCVPGLALAWDDWDEGWDDDDHRRRDLGLVVHGEEDHLATDMGVAILLGGGTSRRVADGYAPPTTAGGSWHARTVIGTRSFVGLELAYVGSLTPIRAGGTAAEEDLLLLSNGGEAGLRAQVPFPTGIREQTLIAPFGFAGAGAHSYDAVDLSLDLRGDQRLGDDWVWHLPVGAGIAVLSEGFAADARLTYRPAIAGDAGVFGGDNPFSGALDEIGVSASVGVEF